ncbi:uncharacterized protein LOC141618677 [Silene latifolia]|uniref:uncharacterized protein LOC141618677 n=1 Tax=Silene latifolia TaxID=37657 RepID=UPI003D76DBC2
MVHLRSKGMRWASRSGYEGIHKAWHDIASTSNSNNNRSSNSPKLPGRPSLRVSPLRFETELEPIIEDEEYVSEAEIKENPPEERPILQLLPADVEGEISFWSTAVFCYILGANPPSTMISGFIKSVWPNNGVDKPVIIKEWNPDVALIKHDVQRVPIWMKMYGLEVKFWGKESLRKLSGEVGSFIKCDESTANRNFFGFARVLVEVQIGQSYPKELKFKDELGQMHRVRVEYDWLPLQCTKFKGLGHLQEDCRKGEPWVTKKVWRPKPRVQKPQAPKHTAKPAPQASPTQDAPVTTPVCTPQPAPARVESPEEGVQKVGAGLSFPRRILSRMMRQKFPDSRQYTPRGITFLDALNLSISKSVSAGKRGLMNLQIENGSSNWAKVKNNICQSWSICTNSSQHKGGRIWLVWQPTQYVVDVRCITDQIIHSLVTDKARGTTFWFTLVYGFNKNKERESLWSKLHQISAGINAAWMVCGDFNSLMNTNERIGGAPVSWHDVLPMRHMLSLCNLVEVKSIGAFFTWNNKHESCSKIYSKIDRVFVNGDWLTSFPECFANFLPEGLFDHCPCVVQFRKDEPRRKPPFKYFNMWSLSDEFEATVRQVWGNVVSGSPMFRVVKKLKELKKGFRDLNNSNFSDIENITRVTEISLKEFQKLLVQDPLNVEWCEAAAACAKELITLKKARLQYLLQKSKEKWMDDGDENTAYYHASIKHMRLRNKVYQVKDKDGILCTQPDAIQDAFEAYYRELLGGSKSVAKVNSGIVRRGSCITDEHRALLTAPVTDEEVKTAMFSIPGTKVPGPDGYSSQFFKDAWTIVGEEVTVAVKNAYQSETILKECNNTILTLIPKIDVPESVLQFRPIACCNTIYKCVAKVMCNRLSSILPDIISHSQSAFIKGRDIVGNILITQDLIKMYKRKACSPKIMMKVDLQKAYDSVEWSFLKEMLEALKFPPQFVKLIMQCVSTTSYSISLNGNLFGYFQGKRGLRQGAPLSPLLFTICLEYLSRLIEWVQIRPEFRFHPFCKRISARIHGLGARKLSYAGRVVLIKSVLSTLRNYWARIFILPKTIISKIEALCKKFLWYGNECKGSPALVSWEQVRWIHAIYIKNQNWLDYKLGTGVSWAWKKICWVKDIMKPFFLNQGITSYEIKEGYQWLIDAGTVKSWHPWISNSLIIPRHKFNIWLISHKRLLTMDRLVKMGIIQTNNWLKIKVPQQDFIMWWVKYRTRSLVVKQVIAMAVASLCYQIWISRNKCRIEGLVPQPRVLVLKFKSDLIMRIRGKTIKSTIGRVHDWLEMICLE